MNRFEQYRQMDEDFDIERDLIEPLEILFNDLGRAMEFRGEENEKDRRERWNKFTRFEMMEFE